MLIFQKQAAGAVPEHCSKTSWQILPKGDRGQGQLRLQKATEQSESYSEILEKHH